MRYISSPVRFICLAIGFLGLPAGLAAQVPTVEEVLEKSIAYHDPQGEWGRFDGSFTVRSETPGKEPRMSYIRINQPESFFGIRMEQNGAKTELELREGGCRLLYNGSETFSDEVAEKHRLSCERARLWRDYYSYLYGLPMKLGDKGTKLDPHVESRNFHGGSYWVIKVTYDPKTGSDTWFFYFDTQTFALAAYQFYHDVAKNDGEYILLEGEAKVGNMRLPRIRKWYTNQGEKHLGTDSITQPE